MNFACRQLCLVTTTLGTHSLKFYFLYFDKQTTTICENEIGRIITELSL